MKREGPRTLCCRNPLVFNKVSTSSQKGAGSSFPFGVDPVLGILDVLSRMEQRVTIKAIIDIAGMRHILSCDNAHERVILADAHFSSIRRASSSGWLPGN